MRPTWTLEELIEIMFRGPRTTGHGNAKFLREVLSDRISKRKGFRKAGIRIRLDKKTDGQIPHQTPLGFYQDRTTTKRTRRSASPFAKRDLVYRHLVEDVRPGIQRPRCCALWDTSGVDGYPEKNIWRAVSSSCCTNLSAPNTAMSRLPLLRITPRGKKSPRKNFFYKGGVGWGRSSPPATIKRSK